MTVYFDQKLVSDTVRTHPWSFGKDDPTHLYRDFKQQPSLIRTALEDFVPLGQRPAIETFYQFLEWVNGPESALETYDCATRPPSLHQNKVSSKLLCISGRVMLLCRDLELNTREDCTIWITRAFHHYIGQQEPDLPPEAAVVAVSHQPAKFTLGDLNELKAGHQVFLSWWAFGDDESEVFSNLDRAFNAIKDATVSVSDGMRAGTA